MHTVQYAIAHINMREGFTAYECIDATDYPPTGFCAWPYNGNWRKEIDGRDASGQFAHRLEK